MSINQIEHISTKEPTLLNSLKLNNTSATEFDFIDISHLANINKLSNESNLIASPINEIDGFLFDIYEEDNYLFLFLKVPMEDKFNTICVQIEEPRYYLYFYPKESDKKLSLIDEVRKIAKKCGGYFIESKNQNLYQTKSYAFDNENIPKEGEWLCASFSRNCDLSLISPKGQNYQFVFGLKNRLIDCFCVHNMIKGPQWVHINKIQLVQDNKYSSTPTYKIKNPKRVTLINNDNKKIPKFNICSMAIRYIRDTPTNEDRILMISMKIRDNCDIENYKSPKRKTTFVNIDQDLSSTIDNVITCNNESQLLELFSDTIDECDIDIICSYNLSNDINLIKKRMTALGINDKWQVGRIKFIEANSTTPAHYPRGGRLFCNLESMCEEFIKSSSNSFNHIVAQEFDNIYRQPLEQVDIVKEIKKIPQLISLIKYNVRDASFIDALIKKMNLFHLTLQLSKLSGCRWSRILGGSQGGGPSSRCEALFVHTFSELGFIIPDKFDSDQQKTVPNVQIIENQEGDTIRRRVPQLKGGRVLEPKTGFYDNCVLVLDFNSLYPSIIREYNLCFTTIGNIKPEDDESRIDLAHNKTQKALPGILPSIMANLLEARLKVKKELAEVEKHITHVSIINKESNTNQRSNDDKNWLLKEKRLKIQQAALKILANAMYGYLGFPYSRFPAIHIAEMVTCLGREILNSTAEKITQLGHNVIYGDTDSVMIRTNTKDWKVALKMAEEIGNQISSDYKYLRLGVESIFMKLLLLNKKKYASLVFETSSINNTSDFNINIDDDSYSNELLKHTWLKIAGLDVIRREWCPLSKYLGTFALKCFMYSRSQSDASTLIINEIKRISCMLLNDGQPISTNKFNSKKDFLNKLKTEITVDDLIVTKGITKSLDQYKSTDKTFNVTVGRWMEKNGFIVKANDVIPYVVINNKANEAELRAKYPDIVYNICEADVEYYLTNQLLPPLLRICEPFQSPPQETIEAAFGLIAKNPKAVKKNYILTNSALNIIPTHKILTQLYFTCPICNTQSLVKNLLSKSSIPRMDSNISPVICPSCNESVNWKPILNSIIIFVKQQLEKWSKSIVTCNCGYFSEIGRLPLNCEHPTGRGRPCTKSLKADISNIDILKTLISFHKLFRELKIIDNPVLALFCDNASYYLMGIIRMHGLNRIQFKSIISVDSFNSLSSE